MYEKKLEKSHQCPLEYVFEVFGGKWSSKIFCLIVKEGPIRYTDFRGRLADISDPVLSSTLKHLVKNGIIERKHYDEMPMRVEYSITEKGRSAIPLLEAICKWSSIHNPNPGNKILAQCNDCEIWKWSF